MGDRPALQPTAYEDWRTEQIRFTGPWFAYSWLETDHARGVLSRSGGAWYTV